MQPKTQNKSILLVDDNIDQLELLTMLFANRYSKIYIAKSIKEGAKVLRCNPIDVMITDFSMPDGTGEKLLQEPKNSAINVLISGFPFEEKEWHHKFGFDAYFLKPCEHDELLKAVEKCVSTRKCA